MKRIIRIMMLLAVMTAAAGEAWAEDAAYGKIIYEFGTGGSDGGELFFFASADDASAWTNELEDYEPTATQVVYNLSNVTLTDGKVYILAHSDGTHTGNGVTITAGKSGGSDMAQARRYSADDSGVQMNSIEVSAVSGKPCVYCIEMPADDMNVTISAKFAAKATNAADISYIDADGVTQTKAAGDVYVLDGTEYWLGVYGKDTWYVCNSTLEYKHVLEAGGDVHLILADRAKMSVEGVDGIRVEKSLTIYGQSNGDKMGSLTAKGERYGIVSDETGSVTINGGEVTATGYSGINVGNSVTINGGKVTAKATDENGYGISGGDITLGWNSVSDKVYAKSYHISGTGSVRTADNKVLKYTDNDGQTVTLMGTLNATTITAIADKTLTPYGIFGYCGKDDPATTDADESKNVTWEIPIVDGAMGSTMTISGKGKMADYDNNNASVAGNFAPWIKPSADGKGSDGLKYESVTAVKIGDGVTSIGKKSFDGCGGITSVTIGKDVTTIGNYAFYCCIDLTSVTIGEGVTTIGESAFMVCDGLTSVNIPANVTEIGNYAFNSCGELTTVTVNRNGSGITALGGNVFTSSYNLKLILVPNEAAYNAYYGSDGKGWGDYKDKLAPQTMTLAKNASGWGTYCHRFPVSYSVDGATAYAVTGLSEDGKSVEKEETAAVAPATPLLLNYGSTGSVTLTADLTTVTAVEDGDIVSTGEDNCIFSGNTTGSPKKHTADTDDGIPALTGVAGETSYALYNGNFLRIDTDNGIDAHRCVLTVNGAASPDVIALSTAEVTPGTDGRIGRIVYSKGEDDNGKLYFYKDEGLTERLTPGEDWNTKVLEEVKDDKENVVGRRIYVYAVPKFGYTVNGMTLQAELTTSAQQSRRFDSADTPTLPIGRAIELTPVEGMPYIFTMVMPNDPNLNASVTATFAAKATNTAAVEYIDADGVKKTKAEGTVYVLDGTEEVLGLFTAEEDVWYVCNSTLDYKHDLQAASDVHLILADGAKMSVEDEKNHCAIELFTKALTIYGQSTGKDMGSLTVTGRIEGIGTNESGSVTINGGVVTATGKYGIKCGNSVTINGGKVTATGEEGYGIISNGDIILGWNSATGSITATSYDTPGYVKTADGKMLKYTNDNSQTVTLMGTLNATTIAAIARKELTPYGIFGYCGKADVNDGKNVVWEILAEDDAATTTIDESKTLNIMKNADVTGQNDFSMADYENNDASVAGNFAPWIKPSDNGKGSAGLKYPVTAVNIGDGVTSIGKKAFDHCGGLISVTIGEGVTTIGERAFNGCGGLTTVTFGEGVTTIGNQAFNHCVGLNSVNIPASVTTIGNDAFSGCGELTTVTVNRYVSDDGENPITTLGAHVFDGCGNLALILVPNEAAYDEYYEGKGWNNYKDKLAPQKLTVAKNASGWGTYCHRFHVSYSVDGATAYAVTGLSKDGKSVSISEPLTAVAPATPLLLNYGSTGSVTLTAVPGTAKTVEDGDIVSTDEDNCIFSGNTTGSPKKHTADTDDGIPALTGVAGETSYALYNGNFLRIDTDNGIDGHRCVLTVNGAASPEVIALSTAVVTPGEDGGIGRIVYSKGEDDHGELSFYKDEELSLAKKLTTGAALNTEGLEAVEDDDEHVVGYRIYVYAQPDEGYTVNGMTLKAELSTAAQQSRRFDSADTPTLKIGGAIELTPVPGMPYIFTMVMPNDPNINASVTATFAAKAKNTDDVSYIDADGATKEKKADNVYVLDGTEEVLGVEGKDTWYVCNSKLDYKRALGTVSDIHLILADGAKMSVEGEVGIALGQSSLTIYGQSNGDKMGSLTATGVRIGMNGSSYGSVTINGGEVTATGYHGISAKNVTINGGKVTATGTGEEGYGIFSSYGDIILGWNSATGSVRATSYGTYGSVKTADGKVLKYTDDDSQTVTLMGTLDATTIAAIADKELTPYGYGGYCGKDDTETADADESKNVTWEIPLVDGGSTLTISGTGDMADYDENGGPWKELSPVVATIGSGVTAIGANAFAGCDDLALILVPDMTAYDDFAQKVSDADKVKLAPNVMSVAKNASGWSTYCHRFPVSYSAEGATAYTVSGLSTSGENVSVTATTGNLVAPAVPLLLGYSGTDDITLTAAPATATTPTADAIVSYSGTGFTYYGNPSGTENLSTDEITDCVYVYPNTAGQQSYVLSEGAFIMVNGTTGGIAPHRCWLNIAGSNAARALTIGGDETTGVKEREAHKYSPDIYTLDGRKVNGKPTKKGMYINGDRKVVIK